MSSLAAELASLLGTVRRPGDFFAAGTAELLAPSLAIEGVGPVALPLLPEQAERIVGVAEAAPYGRGEETVVDPAVRRCWQIGPDRVRLGGRHWARRRCQVGSSCRSMAAFRPWRMLPTRTAASATRPR